MTSRCSLAICLGAAGLVVASGSAGSAAGAQAQGSPGRRSGEGAGASASTSSDTRPRSRGSRSSAIACRAPIGTGRPSIGSKAQLKSYGCTNTERLRYEYAAAHHGPLRQPARPSHRARQFRLARAHRPRREAERRRGIRFPDAANNDPNKQTDPRLRELNMQPSTPGPREEVYCTKIGADPSRRDVHRQRTHGRARLR